MLRLYKYITKLKNRTNHILPKQAWRIGFKVQKTIKSKILSSLQMLNIMKWFKRCVVKNILELSSDAMKYGNTRHISRGIKDEVARC